MVVVQMLMNIMRQSYSATKCRTYMISSNERNGCIKHRMYMIKFDFIVFRLFK